MALVFSVASCLKRISFVLLLMVVSQAVSAWEYDAEVQKIYYGDLDGDGDEDMLIWYPDDFVLIAGDINIPLLLGSRDTFAIFQHASSYSAPQYIKVSKSEVETLGLVQAHVEDDFLLADFDGDGVTDVFLRGSTSTDAAIIIRGTPTGAATLLADYKASPLSDGKNLSDRQITLTAEDVDKDGKADLREENGYDQDIAYLTGSGSSPSIKHEISGSGGLEGNLIGSTAGTFRVSESGAATYSVPITVTKGTAGVTPEISLNYSSQGGNYIAGQGWSIGGLGGISRCRQTSFQDKNVSAISFGASDRFCLNGQRLIVESGSYGAPGSVYRTEIDSFQKITAVGGTTGAPDYFSVEAKDGSTRLYGNTGQHNSEQRAYDLTDTTTNHTLTWAISRFEDSVGNQIVYEYDSDVSGHRIKKVSYAYGSGENSNASINFEYEAKPDGEPGFVSGYKFPASKRLNKIVSKEGLETVREYNLAYLPEETNNKSSRLSHIQECVGTKCLPATDFSWSAPVIGFGLTPASQSLSLDDDNFVADFKILDINGDGILDVVFNVADLDPPDTDVHDQYFFYALGSTAGLGATQQFYQNTANVPPNQTFKLKVVDYNADGKQDVAIYLANKWQILRSTYANGAWGLSGPPVLTSLSERDIEFSDMNGDGLADAVTMGGYYPLVKSGSAVTSSSYYKFSNTKTSLPLSGVPVLPQPTAQLEPNEILDFSGADTFIANADFNGDGAMDALVERWRVSTVMEYHSSPGGEPLYVPKSPTETYYSRKVYLLLRSGNQLVNAGEITTYSALNIAGTHKLLKASVADLNSDGLPDVVTYSNSLRYLVSTGNGMLVNSTSIPIPDDQQVFLSDHNRDGKQDALWHHKSSGKLKAAYWNPVTGGFDAAIDAGTTSTADEDSFIVTDMTGDGVADLVKINRTHVYRYPNVNTTIYQPTNVIKTFTNGLGAVTNVTYHALSNSTHYTPSLDGQSGTTYYSALNGNWSVHAESVSLGKPEAVLLLESPMNVVARVQGDAPIEGNLGATSQIDYHYAGAKFQSGVGFLGFEKLKTVDTQTNVSTETIYRQDWPFVGRPASTSVRSGSGYLLSESINVYHLQDYVPGWINDLATYGSSELPAIQPYLKKSIDKTYDLDANGTVAGALLTTTTSSTEYDDEGNVTSLTESVEGGGQRFDKTVLNTYGTSAWEKEKGRLTQTTVSKSRFVESGGNWNTASTSSKSSSFEYFTSGSHKGLLKKETLLPGVTNFENSTTYTYDAFGNIATKTLEAPNLLSRTVTTAYDGLGRYPTQTTNALGHVVQSISQRHYLGGVEQASDANGLTQYAEYDEFGREVRSWSNTGAETTTSIDVCNISQPGCYSGAAGEVYVVTTTGNDGSESKEYFDKLARPVRTEITGFDGAINKVATYYDSLGRVAKKTEPYTGSSASYFSIFNYDILGRVTVTELPGHSAGSPNVVTAEYDGFTTKHINQLNHSRIQTNNAIGELAKVVDAVLAEIRYEYNAEGNLRYVRRYRSASDPSPIVTEMNYDPLGNKSSMNDPDKGSWSYTYNAFGELVSQTDAKNQSVLFEYDQLGRMYERTEKNSSGGVEYFTKWYFDTVDSAGLTVGNAIGLPTEIVKTNSESHTTCASVATSECTRYQYDAYGRQVSVTNKLATDGTYQQAVDYDALGRVDVEYDAVDGQLAIGGALQASGTRNIYNAYGYLQSIQNLATDEYVYSVTGQNARGQLTGFAFANGMSTTFGYSAAQGRLVSQQSTNLSMITHQNIAYQWDLIGNLTSRHNQSGSKNLQEAYCYDNLNRLIDTDQGVLTRTCPSTATADYRYDALGNLTYKAGMGFYSYTAGSQPHAVKAIGNLTFQYDANGNMTLDKESGVTRRSIQYTVFDKPSSITKGSTTINFEYGSDHKRWKRTDVRGSTTTNTLYIGNVERIHQVGSSEVKWKRHINGVAIYTITANTSDVQTGTTRQFLHKDHLGSIDIITDEVGNVVQALAFDAWGARQNTSNNATYTINELSTTALVSALNGNTTRGYTGHEMLDDVGLIHMNGRIYDPLIGRFMQADPFVQAADDMQMYNRYSYVRNNPLNATDPSGYIAVTLIAGLILSSAKVSFDIWFVGLVMGAAGFADAIFTGASFKEALRAGFMAGISAAAFAAVGGSELFGLGKDPTTQQLFVNALGNGVVGGIMNELGGGNFGHGFLSAGLSALGKIRLRETISSMPLRVAARAIIGGTISQVTGGKFANGAATAAFAQLFNEELSNKPSTPEQKAREQVDWGKFESEMKRLSLMGSDEVFKEAGFSDKQIQDFELENACSTRVSIALTNSGSPITSGGFNPAGTRVITSVHRMAKYLTKTFGPADSTWAGGSGVAGQVGSTGRGIVMYRDPSGGAGLNHVTAWSSGGKVALDGWFNTAPEGTTASYWRF